MPRDFELLPHTADIKIRVYGTTLNDLFRNAVVGMFQAIGPIITGCTLRDGRVICPNLPQRRQVSVHAMDYEALLVDFLSEAIYLSDIHNEAYLDAMIHEIRKDKTGMSVSALLMGIQVKGFEVVEIKAVTHHDLRLIQNNGIWQTDIVFDI